jgi:hypothetical protein
MNAMTIRPIGAIATLVVLIIQSCAPESVTPSAVTDARITQEQLDGATITTTAEYGITGDPFKAFGTDTVTTLHKIRYLASSTDRTVPVGPGSIWVRRAYMYDVKTRGTLINDVIMVKREGGYYPGGGDFEYMTIPYDSTVNYVLHPNGMLPETGDTLHRGYGAAVQKCVSCHATAGDDRLFTR